MNIQEKKNYTIQNWKRIGVKYADWNELFEYYYYSTECERCEKDFKSERDKCLDHNHETGKPRNVLCQKCNNAGNWKPIPSIFDDEKSGGLRRITGRDSARDF